MTQGLVIRPSSTNGSALGRGLYFADWADKSIGYTSLKGSRWGNGRDNPACMAVFSVKLGREKKVKEQNREGHEGAARGEYDSMHAVAPPNPISWPRRDEFTVYNDAQATIAFIVELVGEVNGYE
jgi:poly [ADP-ribose] polymerase